MRPRLVAAAALAAAARGWLQPPHADDADARPWCARAADPRWPFAYSRGGGAPWERKGRTASSLQSLGHACALRGARSKCHRCGAFACGAGLNATCALQLQGVDWGRLPVNAPTAADAPFAVGAAVAHRYDFGAAERACVLTSGDARCVTGDALDYARCALRCWGPGGAGPPPPLRTATGWAWAAAPPTAGGSSGGSAQGRVWTLAGGAPPPADAAASSSHAGAAPPPAGGHADGAGAAARFRGPQGVAVSSDGATAYVADSGNHVIRAVALADGATTTLAGLPGEPGFEDGAGAAARFSAPSGLALYVDCGVRVAPLSPAAPPTCTDVLIVADTGNHVIRAVVGGVVRTLAGGGGANRTRGAVGLNEAPPFGYADGPGRAARFDTPTGVAADDAGNVFVADTRNHLLRWVDAAAGEVVRTLAGRVAPTPRELPGCPQPCLRGVPGMDDGATTAHANATAAVPAPDVAAQLHFPYGVALGPGRPYTLLVLDGDRVRLVTRSGQDPWAVLAPWHQHAVPIPGVTGGGSATLASPAEIASLDRVVTLVGVLDDRGRDGSGGGEDDGDASEGRLDKPRALAVDPSDGRVYVADAARCRVRVITPASQLALPDMAAPLGGGGGAACALRGADLVTPPGCSSVEPPVDAEGRLVSPHRAWLSLNMPLPPPPASGGNGSTAAAAHRVYVGGGSGAASSLLRELDGRRVAVCVGPAPPDVGTTSTGSPDGPVGGTQWARLDVDEDAWQGSRVLVACPPGCAGAGAMVVGDANVYDDASSVCAAAVHAGAVPDATGGTVFVTFGKGVGPGAGAASPHAALLPPAGGLPGSSRNGVTSLALADASRTFSLAPLAAPTRALLVRTLAGAPASPLDSACGFADGSPPTAARFHGPAGIAVVRPRTAGPAGAGASAGPPRPLLVVVDGRNHAVRALSPACSLACENGGTCVGTEQCACAAGWAGVDCTRPVCSGAAACGLRRVCVGPATCACFPGYTGDDCATATCVQRCGNGGRCAAPDTCACAPGWFDPSCSTPVCSQTCGNGGNCTGPSVCSCPAWWGGADCRTPVCPQGCANGGVCVAPNTCACPPAWSGHDCRAPVCHQGFFRAATDDSSWAQFVPCDYAGWCAATREFECRQQQRVRGMRPAPAVLLANVSGWGVGGQQGAAIETVAADTAAGGNASRGSGCTAVELPSALRTPFRLQRVDGSLSDYARWSRITQYGWGGAHAWSAPAATSNDRQIAAVSWVAVPQGAYECANGGACTAPDYCVCAPGWTGFDCRTPVCAQGFYYPRDADPAAPGRYADPRFPEQGTYVTSRRTLTPWEHPPTPGGKYRAGYMHEHPNFRSRAADSDPSVGLADAYVRVAGRGNDTNEGWRRDGWFTRAATPWGGFVEWHPGNPLVMAPRFVRVCRGARPAAGGAPPPPLLLLDLRTGQPPAPGGVDSTADAFAPRWRVNDSAVESDAGAWDESGGGGGGGGGEPAACVDTVRLGCFNEGVCVAPDTCVCAPGWAGDDCSLPLCAQAVGAVTGALPLSQLPPTLVRAPPAGAGAAAAVPQLPPSPRDRPPGPGDALLVQYFACPHRGNCTHPGVCTCEKGWAGANCTTPLCAQECLNGGSCTAPDVCTCAQWPSRVRDARGVPAFQKPDGSPQDTGWTGYDCGTPICVQAAAWVPNDDTGRRFVALETTANDGKSFQGGCGPPLTAGGGGGVGGGARRYAGSGSRVSARYLCGLTEWWMGSYAQPWANDDADASPASPSAASAGRVVRVNTPNYQLVARGAWRAGPAVPGEGLYACANRGSCVAPDTCVCPDGWAGADCATPLCRHVHPANNTLLLGCANGGICASKDTCVCPRVPSVLWVGHPASPAAAPRGAVTGFAGEQCTKPMCAQGFFVETCQNGVDGRSDPGCWRCPNGGNCTAPDTCACPRGSWTGFDCRTPVCAQRATAALAAQLHTGDARKVAAFEEDPCGARELVQPAAGSGGGGGRLVPRGNCSRPGTCTCLCRRPVVRDGAGKPAELPWRDPLGLPPPAGWVYGDGECLDGYQGTLNADGSYGSCHLRIYVPSWLQRHAVYLLGFGVGGLAAALLLYVLVRRTLRARHRRLKAERRKRRQQQQHVAAAAAPLGGAGVGGAGAVPPGARRRRAGDGGGSGGAAAAWGAADADSDDGAGGDDGSGGDADAGGRRRGSGSGLQARAARVWARLLTAGGDGGRGAAGDAAARSFGAFTHRDAAAVVAPPSRGRG